MRTDVHHLPQKQQDELARVVRILMEEFETYSSNGTQNWRRNGKIYKIILFGSYARDDWVDEPENGYQSDFDLLIIVNNEKLTDVAEYWFLAEDRILRDPEIARPVNIMVHTLQDVNSALMRGEYFWVDIARDGVALYELLGKTLVAPAPLTAADAFRMAQEYYDEYSGTAADFLQSASDAIERDKAKLAAFLLHQTTERLYICYLLVRTHYFPRSHNIKFLRSLAEDKEPRLIAAWPRETKIERRLFERLKRAYVESRYSPTYKISREDLEALMPCILRLRDLVEELCREQLEELRKAAG